jgi:hypothetical protein
MTAFVCIIFFFVGRSFFMTAFVCIIFFYVATSLFMTAFICIIFCVRRSLFVTAFVCIIFFCVATSLFVTAFVCIIIICVGRSLGDGPIFYSKYSAVGDVSQDTGAWSVRQVELGEGVRADSDTLLLVQKTSESNTSYD